MLVIRLLGGLGNQLFQVAFAHRMVMSGRDDVVLDTSAFGESRTGTPRRLEIDRDAVGLRMISMPRPVERIAMRLHEPLHVREAGMGDDVFERVVPRTRLVTGYFQSWELADLTADAMAEVFARHARPVPHHRPFVALHARLGDYLSDPSTLRYHGVTSPAWLVHTARALKHEVGVAEIRVFTDSPRYFRALAEPAGLDDLVFDDSTQAWEVISSMQQASGFVLSNSSLSWWAAFASRRFLGSDAPVVAPLPWLAEASPADTLLLGPDWRPALREMVSADQARAVGSDATGQAAPTSGSKALHRSELVLCTRNRVDDLRECLTSVFGADCPPERILVVDSSDGDGTEQLVAAMSDKCPVALEYVRGPVGLTLQRNVGLSLLRPSTQVVHFLDDDVVLEPDYFVAVDAAFGTDAGIAGVGGKITDAESFEPSRLYSLLLLSGRQGAVLRSGHNMMATDHVADTDVEWLSGCSMSYRVGHIDGLRFDVRRAGYGLGEDVDFSMRAAERGRLVWTPAARLEHHQGDRGPNYYFVMRRAGVRNQWMLASDRLGRVRRWAVVYATLAWVLKGSLAAAARGNLRQARKYRVGIDGLADLVRERRTRSNRGD